MTILPSLGRRQFMQAAAAGLATAAVNRKSAGTLDLNRQDEPEKRFKKAVKIGMVRVPGSLADKFHVLRELGFDGVELDSPGGPAAADVRAAIDQTGILVHGVVDSVHWRDTLSHPEPPVRAKGVDALKKAIIDAKQYGGSSVLLVPAVCRDGVTYEQAWERSTEEVKKVLPLAEDQEIDILFENVWNNFLTDPQETAKYIDQFGSKRVGAYYDVGNSVRYAPPLQWVQTLGDRIKKLDIKEYDLEKGKAEGWGAGFQVKLLDGTCNWPGVVGELKKLDFRGWATAEIPGGDRARLQEIADRMDRIFASA